MSWVFWVVAMVFVVGVIYGIFRACEWIFVESRQDRKTIDAIFLRSGGFQGEVRIEDRSRLLGNNTQVALEHWWMVFQNCETGEELRFKVDYNTPHDWKEYQKGKLTYSGKRYIMFQ